MTREALAAAMAELGLTASLAFVAWPVPEHMGWRARVTKNGKLVLDTIHIAPAGYTPPEPVDVIAALIANAGVLDYDTFEDWALANDANPDSRAAERIYTTLRAEAELLRAAVAREGLERLKRAAGL